jgi:hypothetical protein
VQQDQRRRVFRARFPIEDPDAINLHAVIGRCSRRRLQRSSLRSINEIRVAAAARTVGVLINIPACR